MDKINEENIFNRELRRGVGEAVVSVGSFDDGNLGG